jgi:hypothetical protein
MIRVAAAGRRGEQHVGRLDVAVQGMNRKAQCYFKSPFLRI